jgi:hypothetical protein
MSQNTVAELASILGATNQSLFTMDSYAEEEEANRDLNLFDVGVVSAPHQSQSNVYVSLGEIPLQRLPFHMEKLPCNYNVARTFLSEFITIEYTEEGLNRRPDNCYAVIHWIDGINADKKAELIEKRAVLWQFNVQCKGWMENCGVFEETNAKRKGKHKRMCSAQWRFTIYASNLNALQVEKHILPLNIFCRASHFFFLRKAHPTYNNHQA